MTGIGSPAAVYSVDTIAPTKVFMQHTRIPNTCQFTVQYPKIFHTLQLIEYRSVLCVLTSSHNNIFIVAVQQDNALFHETGLHKALPFHLAIICSQVKWQGFNNAN